MKQTTLVIMAAGIGSRFGGGIKQLEPVGPGGEIIMDYSIHDALEAGFNRIVFIIRRELEQEFREGIGKRAEHLADVTYVYQELEDLPKGYDCPRERKKPWGTGQAVLMVKGVVEEPFLVINADDYYGKESFSIIHDYMVNEMKEEGEANDICMSGFILSNTLSENGTVTRGVCELNRDSTLKTVKETYNIEMKGETLLATDEMGNPVDIKPDQLVSMNMWGLSTAFLEELEDGFSKFLDQLEEGDLKSEYLLPKVIDRQIREGKATVKVLETKDRWFGVTYKEDKKMVTNRIKELIAAGVYKEKLYD